MRFLADECCPAQIVAALRKAGHDVRYVLETDRGAEDREVADLAAREDRVVVTEDYGFGELAVRERLPLPRGDYSFIWPGVEHNPSVARGAGRR